MDLGEPDVGNPDSNQWYQVQSKAFDMSSETKCVSPKLTGAAVQVLNEEQQIAGGILGSQFVPMVAV